MKIKMGKRENEMKLKIGEMWVYVEFHPHFRTSYTGFFACFWTLHEQLTNRLQIIKKKYSIGFQFQLKHILYVRFYFIN